MASKLDTLENDLIASIKLGRSDALSNLIDIHGEQLMRYITSITNNKALAEDIFQDTWIRVIKKIHTFDSNKPFAPWLFTIARNRTFDLIRKVKHETPIEENIYNHKKENRLIKQVENKDLIMKILNRLTPKHREVIWLRFFGEKEYEEIGIILKIPLGTVKSRLKRALNNVIKIYKELEDIANVTE